MEHDRNKFTEEVFDSMIGSQPALPPEDLFEQILDRVGSAEDSGLPFKRVFVPRWLAAAAIALLLVNGGILLGLFSGKIESPFGSKEEPTMALMSDYNFYQ